MKLNCTNLIDRVNVFKLSDLLWKGNVLTLSVILDLSIRYPASGPSIRGPADVQPIIRLLHEQGWLKPIKFCPEGAAPWIGVQYGREGIKQLKSSPKNCEEYWSWEVTADFTDFVFEEE